MKRYLITGASRGIGRAIAEKLAAPDVVLLLHGRDTVALADVCKSVKPSCLRVVRLIHDLVRKEFGIVGAICINVDVNYLTDEVMSSKERIEAFFQNFCRTETQLDENILSKDEYAKALKGKRHFKDEKW